MKPLPARPVTKPFTIDEIRAQLETGAYDSEWILNHLCLAWNERERKIQALREDSEKLHEIFFKNL